MNEKTETRKRTDRRPESIEKTHHTGRRPALPTIDVAVANAFAVPVEHIIGKEITRLACDARQAGMLIAQEAGYSSQEIAAHYERIPGKVSRSIQKARDKSRLEKDYGKRLELAGKAARK